MLDGIYRLQRQGKEELNRLQATVDYLQDSFASLDDGAVMIDKQGNIGGVMLPLNIYWACVTRMIRISK